MKKYAKTENEVYDNFVKSSAEVMLFKIGKHEKQKEILDGGSM